LAISNSIVKSVFDFAEEQIKRRPIYLGRRFLFDENLVGASAKILDGCAYLRNNAAQHSPLEGSCGESRFQAFWSSKVGWISSRYSLCRDLFSRDIFGRTATPRRTNNT
jgi:hypothetical protein